MGRALSGRPVDRLAGPGTRRCLCQGSANEVASRSSRGRGRRPGGSSQRRGAWRRGRPGNGCGVTAPGGEAAVLPTVDHPQEQPAICHGLADQRLEGYPQVQQAFADPVVEGGVGLGEYPVRKPEGVFPGFAAGHGGFRTTGRSKSDPAVSCWCANAISADIAFTNTIHSLSPGESRSPGYCIRRGLRERSALTLEPDPVHAGGGSATCLT